MTSGRMQVDVPVARSLLGDLQREADAQIRVHNADIPQVAAGALGRDFGEYEERLAAAFSRLHDRIARQIVNVKEAAAAADADVALIAAVDVDNAGGFGGQR